MNDQAEHADKTAEQWAAFQKIWTETFAKMMQLGFTYSPEAAPPEFLRQIRSGIFQAMAQAWDQFLRSPQFLEGSRQWMDQAVKFRKMTNDFFAKARHETQGTARRDVDGVLLALQKLEARILDRIDDLAEEVEALKGARPGRRAGQRKTRPKRKDSP